MKKTIFYLIATLMLTLVACGGNDSSVSDNVPVSGISLDVSAITLAIGENKPLVATVKPNNATNQKLTWTSSSPTVASVTDNGLVNALRSGTAVIIASSSSGHTATCVVTVAIPVTSVSVYPGAITLAVGGSMPLVAIVQPSDATNQTVTWSSVNPAIARVDDNGVVTAMISGSTTIIVMTQDGSKIATCSVDVPYVAMTGVTLNKSNTTLGIGESETLSATLWPGNASDRGVSWSSDNNAIATVSANGTVVGVAAGSATMTVTTVDGSHTASCNVNVIFRYATGIRLNKADLSLIIDSAETLVATVEPTNATNKTVLWASDNSAVASVSSSGAVTAHAVGRATITATTQDGGHTAICILTVSDVYIVGYEEISGRTFAKLWKTKTVASLSDGTNSAEILSVFVSGHDVYMAGYERVGTRDTATLWKNQDDPVRIGSGSSFTYANSIFVSGGDVFLAGNELVSGRYVATLWKNGTPPVYLSNATSHSQANSVFVSGDDVYVVGYEDNKTTGKSTAMLWKNNETPRYLSDGNFMAKANSVVVSGGDVYVAGYENNAINKSVATLWKNNVTQNLSNGGYDASATSVFVLGSDVYVVGYERNSQSKAVATLWKNGAGQNLSNGGFNAYANSVFVHGNDVYVVGVEENSTGKTVARLWKNGFAQSLSDGNNNAVAKSVYVK